MYENTKEKRKKIMSMIYFVITCIMAVFSWACSQMDWMYRQELFYIVLFITGIFLISEEIRLPNSRTNNPPTAKIKR